MSLVIFPESYVSFPQIITFVAILSLELRSTDLEILAISSFQDQGQKFRAEAEGWSAPSPHPAGLFSTSALTP